MPAADIRRRLNALSNRVTLIAGCVTVPETSVAERNNGSLSPECRAQAREELRAILQSAAFRGSKRGQQFLQYVVENSLAGHTDLLKERSIGVELFGRKPSYETGEDSVVRVTAKEVRERLKRYRAGLRASRAVLIDIPPGSYVPVCTFPSRAEQLAQFRTPRQRAWMGWAALLGVILAVALGYSLLRPFAISSQDRFWTPLLKAPSPVFITISNLEAYSFPRSRERLGPGRKAGDAVPLEEIAQMNVIASVDAMAAVALSSFLGSKGKTSQMRSSLATSFTDLRGSPALMVGAFSNQWTMLMTKELHFAFTHNRGKDWSIQEQTAPWRHWTLADATLRTVALERDYGLVSRIFDKQTGQPFIAIGGIEGPGTQAAAECLISAQCLAAAVANAPHDWERKNLQFVISTKIISGIPAAPEVVTAYCW